MASELFCPDCGSVLEDRGTWLGCTRSECDAVFDYWHAKSRTFRLPERELEANAGLIARWSLIARVEVVDDSGKVVASADRPGVQTKGIHKDEGKLRVELVPMEGVHAAARAMSYGLVKYPAHNYRLGIAWASIYASIMRHLLLWFWDGRPDEESGLSHLDHAAADVLMLCAIVALHPALDDRPCKK